MTELMLDEALAKIERLCRARKDFMVTVWNESRRSRPKNNGNAEKSQPYVNTVGSMTLINATYTLICNRNEEALSSNEAIRVVLDFVNKMTSLLLPSAPVRDTERVSYALGTKSAMRITVEKGICVKAVNPHNKLNYLAK